MYHQKKYNKKIAITVLFIVMVLAVPFAYAYTYVYETMQGNLPESYCHFSSERQPNWVRVNMLECELSNGTQRELYVYIQENGNNIYTGWLGAGENSGTITCGGGDVIVHVQNPDYSCLGSVNYEAKITWTYN
jgi:hypothetical protein